MNSSLKSRIILLTMLSNYKKLYYEMDSNIKSKRNEEL